MKKEWSADSVVKALEDVQEKKLSLRAAAAKHGVPRSTLHDYVVGKSNIGCTSGLDTVPRQEKQRKNRERRTNNRRLQRRRVQSTRNRLLVAPSRKLQPHQKGLCPICDVVYKEEGVDSSSWVECIGCEEWFHLHCTSIPPRQHARLEQVDFVCHFCHS